ncbi:MAG: hypothetical protein AB4080_14415 [Trichodesmium sp.]
MAASIKEIQQNIIKIQGLIKQAQNPAQKKTFSEILKNLQEQLEEAKKKQKLAQKTSQKLEIKKIVKPIEPEQKSTTESLLAAQPKSQPLPETTQKLEHKSTTKTRQKLDSLSATKTTQQLEQKPTAETTQKLEPLSSPTISNEQLLPSQNTPVIQPEQEPKTPVESEPIAEDKSSTQTSTKIFQGLGIIEGKIIKRFEDNDKYYNIVTGEKTYKLIIHRRRVLDFVKATYNPDETQQLLVYPNLVHYPQPKGGTLPPKISFTLVAGIQELPLGFQVNEFKLCGIYQQIGVYRGTVISVHRNKTNTLKKIVRKFEQRTKNILRANHIPILWKDSPVQPFRFNPRLDKDQQGDRYFVEIKARFLPDREQWGFMELLGEPTLEFPDFMKAPKPSQ